MKGKNRNRGEERMRASTGEEPGTASEPVRRDGDTRREAIAGNGAFFVESLHAEGTKPIIID